MLSPRPISTSRTGLAVRHPVPTCSGTPLTLTAEILIEIFVLAVTLIGYGGALMPDADTIRIGVSSVSRIVAVTDSEDCHSQHPSAVNWDLFSARPVLSPWSSVEHRPRNKDLRRYLPQ